MKASTIAFPLAVLSGIAGMAWGIAMAMSQDHSTLPAHAHLNLLGWVSLFLMAIFYRVYPAIDRSRLAVAQVLVWFVTSALMALGIAFIYSGVPAGEPIAAITSLILLADMLLFGFLVLRGVRGAEMPMAS
jgi:cbb3-type cytochrome oxidase subunit 1